MKKKMMLMLALALIVAMLCGTALAYSGDVTTKAVKAYADAEMKICIGTIPACTAVLVRSYDSYADINVNGTMCYISEAALLHNDSVRTDFVATLRKGTKVFQRPTEEARAATVKKDCGVSIIAVKGDWALVQAVSVTGAYAFVKTDKLVGIYDFTNVFF